MIGRGYRGLALLLGAAVLGGSLVACSAPPAAPVSPAASTSLVLADAYPASLVSPLEEYTQYGVSPLYDGLYTMASTSSQEVPRLEPALASAAPQVSADQTVWTVPLRQGVVFSDGSPFDAQDVVATYENILDPRVGASFAADLDMIETVEALDPATVRFTLKYPYAEFTSILLQGIAPSEHMTHVPVTQSPTQSAPVGTGPYRVEKLTPEETVLVANPTHWRGKPAVERITLVQVKDDNSRAQKMAAGELDGTSLPPALAETFATSPEVELTTVRTVDYRAVALPREGAFVNDPVARLAMNRAVDREAMVAKILHGKGSPLYTPIPTDMGEVADESATLPFDRDGARRALDEAGWVVGPDGVRTRDGQRAAFTVFYPASDTLRGALATAFAADMKQIGVEVGLEGSTWEKIEPVISRNALLNGDGRYPTNVDSLVYQPLHRRTPETTSTYANSGDKGSAELDALLERARREPDAARRAALYREVQRVYVDDPGYVFLVNVQHVYAAKKGAPTSGTTVMEPHTHSTLWGPWWNLGKTS